MTNIGWAAVGEIARKRRERLGLNQDQLALYGGPKVATVGKFERAAQENFPLRTQHQIEKALGWVRGTVEQVVGSINEGRLTLDDWEYDLVEEDVPDMSRPLAPVHEIPQDDPMADPLTMRLHTVRAILTLVPESRQEEAVQAALRTLLTFSDVATASAELAEVHHLSDPPGTTETSVKAAHDDEVPIERGQEHDDHA